MSGCVDFVVAGRKEANAVARENNPGRRWPCASAKFVFHYHLADLWGLLSGTKEEVDDTALAEEGVWHVYPLAAPFVKLLAAVKDGDVPDVGRRWYAGSDMGGLQDESSLAELLGELVKLAREAKRGRKTVLVRWAEG